MSRPTAAAVATVCLLSAVPAQAEISLTLTRIAEGTPVSWPQGNQSYVLSYTNGPTSVSGAAAGGDIVISGYVGGVIEPGAVSAPTANVDAAVFVTYADGREIVCERVRDTVGGAGIEGDGGNNINVFFAPIGCKVPAQQAGDAPPTVTLTAYAVGREDIEPSQVAFVLNVWAVDGATLLLHAPRLADSPFRAVQGVADQQASTYDWSAQSPQFTIPPNAVVLASAFGGVVKAGGGAVSQSVHLGGQNGAGQQVIDHDNPGANPSIASPTGRNILMAAVNAAIASDSAMVAGLPGNIPASVVGNPVVMQATGTTTGGGRLRPAVLLDYWMAVDGDVMQSYQVGTGAATDAVSFDTTPTAVCFQTGLEGSFGAATDFSVATYIYANDYIGPYRNWNVSSPYVYTYMPSNVIRETTCVDLGPFSNINPAVPGGSSLLQ